MTGLISPYLAPGFYEDALARGRHRAIVGGRWDETGLLQLAILQREGLRPQHSLLDIGCGSLRLGTRAIPYLDSGNYWGTDQSAALMQEGYAKELIDPSRLPVDQLIADGAFDFPGVPATIEYAIAFAVFTHLPVSFLDTALRCVRARFPVLIRLLFTVFLGHDDPSKPFRQADGVVTHPDRPPYHFQESEVRRLARRAGFTLKRLDDRLPRGQVMFRATFQ